MRYAAPGARTDHPSPELLPAFLLRRAKREHIKRVMVGGEWLIGDGEHANFNEYDVEREIWGAAAI